MVQRELPDHAASLQLGEIDRWRPHASLVATTDKLDTPCACRSAMHELMLRSTPTLDGQVILQAT